MTIDVPTEYEEILRQAVASGAFETPADAMRHALQLLQREQWSTRSRQDAGTADDAELLPDDLDPDAVAASQGVGPMADPDSGAATSWPEDDDFDAWLKDLRALRGQGEPRAIP